MSSCHSCCPVKAGWAASPVRLLTPSITLIGWMYVWVTGGQIEARKGFSSRCLRSPTFQRGGHQEQTGRMASSWPCREPHVALPILFLSHVTGRLAIEEQQSVCVGILQLHARVCISWTLLPQQIQFPGWISSTHMHQEHTNENLT